MIQDKQGHSEIWFLRVLPALLLTVNILLCSFLALQSRVVLRKQVQDRMLSVANVAANMLNGDVLEELEAKDEGTKGYQEVYDTLANFQGEENLKYIYCIREVGNKQYIFTVDPTKLDPAEFGEMVVYTEALYAASRGQAAVDETSYEDDWGRFYSAYSPVFDSFGDVAGIVAADFSAEWYEKVVNSFAQIILLVCIFIALAGMLLLRFIRKRVQKELGDANEALAFALRDVGDLKNGLAAALGQEKKTKKAESRETEAEEKSVLNEVNLLERQIEGIRQEIKDCVDFLHAHLTSWHETVV